MDIDLMEFGFNLSLTLFQTSEEGTRQCLKLLKLLLTRDSSKLQSVKVVYIQHNLSSVSSTKSQQDLFRIKTDQTHIID